MALQSAQGCRPSNVWLTASVERTRPQIVREHRRPRDRLQHRPVRTGRRHQRHNHTQFAEPREHNGKLSRPGQITSANNDW